MLNTTVILIASTFLFISISVCAEGDYQDPETAYKAARELTNNGDYRQALVIFTRLLEQHPDNADYLLGAGQVYTWQGQPNAAIPLLEQGITVAPDYEDIYRALARAYENSRQMQKARAIYRRAITRFNSPDWAVMGMQKYQQTERQAFSLKLAYRLETLSNNSHDWRDTTVSARVKYDSGRQISFSYVNSNRFGLADDTIAAETYLPINESNLVYGELRYSNSHQVLPEYSVYLQWTHSFAGGWGVIGGYKRVNYTESGVHLIDIGTEYYFSNYRAAYTSVISESDTAGGALSHRFQLGYTFESLSNIQLALATGSEVEKPVSASSIIKTDFTTVTLWGEIMLSRKWALDYAGGYTQLEVNNSAGSNRRFINLGIRYTF